MAYGALISTRIASALLMMEDDLFGRLKVLVKQEEGAAGEKAQRRRRTRPKQLPDRTAAGGAEALKDESGV